MCWLWLVHVELHRIPEPELYYYYTDYTLHTTLHRPTVYRVYGVRTILWYVLIDVYVLTG